MHLKPRGILLLVIACVLAASVDTDTALAAPYRGYSYDYWGDPVHSPQAYVPVCMVTGSDIGVGRLVEPRDLFVDQHSNVYIVDTGNNRIIRTDRDLQVLQVIDSFSNGEQRDTFRKPQGLYVSSYGHIFIADTGNARIVELDRDGRLVRIIGTPTTDSEGVLPDNFEFRPSKVAVDPAGRVYCVVAGVFEGILCSDADSELRGFMGAPRVSMDPVEYFWRRISTREQLERMSLVLPTEYSNIHMDQKGFIYATVAVGSVWSNQAIRRLNPSGVDVLRRTGTYPPIGDVQYLGSWDTSGAATGPSDFVDVCTQDWGLYSVLDRKRGRIFTYDSSGNLLYAFGGLGAQLGLFKDPVALETLDDHIMVLDSTVGAITVFRPTRYASAVIKAIRFYNTGRYDDSVSMWREVLSLNANYELAYIGMGDALLRQGDYVGAMDNYRLGNDRDGYSDAFARYRRELIYSHFGVIMTALVALGVFVAAVIRFGLYSRFRRAIGDWYASTRLSALVPGYVSDTWASLRRVPYIVTHPFDGFSELKLGRRGDLPAACIILVAVTATFLIITQYTGFILNTRDLTELNMLVEAGSVLIPFALWTAVGWATTTLIDGKGTMKEIFIASAYSLTPLVIVNIPLTAISNLITAEEASLYHVCLVGGVSWAIALLFISTSVIHDYDFTKTLLTSLIVLVGMGTAVFIGILFLSVIDLMAGFAKDVFSELTLRRF